MQINQNISRFLQKPSSGINNKIKKVATKSATKTKVKTTSFKEKASKQYSFKPESTNPAVRTKMKEKVAEKENNSSPIAKEQSELVIAGSVSGSGEKRSPGPVRIL